MASDDVRSANIQGRETFMSNNNDGNSMSSYNRDRISSQRSKGRTLSNPQRPNMYVVLVRKS